jgi:oligopeptide transport system substrate-binding protein
MGRWLPVLALALTFAGGSAHSENRQILHRGVYGEPESLSPDRSGVSSETAIVMDLFEGLTTFDASGKVIPGQAESWQVSDDGLRYRFRLRPNLRWSDGTPLTAEDFVYSFRHTMQPATQSTQADRLAILRNGQAVLRGELPAEALGVTAPSPLELILELQHPSPRLPVLLAHSEGFPVPRHRIERLGEAWREPNRMVSNGPFTLVERKPHDRVRLRKNPYYRAANSVDLDEIVYFPSDAVATSVQRFRAQELHINGWPGFLPRQEAFLRRELGDAVRVNPLLIVAYLRFNLRRTALQDPRVRRALSLSVARNTLAKQVLGGGEQPALGVVPPSVTGYQPAVIDAPSELKERLVVATQLLQAAGYTDAAPLKLTLRYPSGQGRDICVAIQAMWRDLPVELTIENSEIKSMIADLRRGEFDLALTGALDADDPERFLDRLLPDSSYNTGRYSNAEFVELMDRAKHTADPKERTRLLSEAETIVLADVPVVPLYFGVSRNLVAPAVKGFKNNPADVHLSRYLRLAN